MGLDLVLGLFVLVAAIRGWFKGFVLQAIRLAGLVACVYEAGPVRDLARPYVEGHLKGIRPDLLDRLLWWTACVLSYVLTVGLATWMVRVYRRRPYGDPDLYRGDQAAGFMLGAAKGLAVAVLLAAAVERYALPHLAKIGGWPEEQAGQSYALAWTQTYRPAARVWATEPVQNFVAYVQRMGLRQPGTEGAGPDVEKAGPEAAQPPPSATARTDTDEPVRTASKPGPLAIPGPEDQTRKEMEQIDAALEQMRRQLRDGTRPVIPAPRPSQD